MDAKLPSYATDSATSSGHGIITRWLSETPIFVIGVALFSTCIGLLLSKGIAPSIDGVIVNTRLFVLFVIVIVAFDAGRELYRHRPDEPVAHLKARYFSPTARVRMAAGAPMLAVAILLLPYFSKMKSAIPLFNDYTWDDAFIEWDRAIFFGYDAWEVLQPVLGFPIVTAFLALLYQLWFLLLYPGVLFFAFGNIDHTIRRQFFLTYVLSWTLIGGLMATLLASVGPCFVGPLLGDPRFDAQMAYLNAANEQIPIMVLPVQEMLLDWYAKAENGLGSGITAMPSMHCAIAFLYWIAMRRISHRLGVFFGVFFFITWISSVHLAYHYAVDGLVSLIAVAVIWAASQRIIKAWDAYRGQPTFRTNTVPAE
ncbi:MAG: phosphatase PAP2 family protein [Pseudomonadota bacterium]|nr:phosphatase PAP2 family protein [Pseudomonadota bacterium]